MDDLDDALRDFRLELPVHVKHRLRALLVKLLNGCPIRLQHRIAEKLLQLRVLLLGRVP